MANRRQLRIALLCYSIGGSGPLPPMPRMVAVVPVDVEPPLLSETVTLTVNTPTFAVAMTDGQARLRRIVAHRPGCAERVALSIR